MVASPLAEHNSPASAQAGGLRRHAEFWNRHARSHFVRSWVSKGFPLQWKDEATPAPPCNIRNHKAAYTPEHKAFISDCVAKLVQANAAQQWRGKPRCVHPLTVVPKKNGKLRLILDLRHVNQYLHVPKFKFESLLELSHLLLPEANMFSIDLQDGYWQLEMTPDSYEYLGFEWEGQYYVFKVLPFGLATAPWAFSKVMREVCDVLRSHGIRLLNYLDDFLFLCNPKLGLAEREKAYIMSVFNAAGLTINAAKSQLAFTHTIVHLGFEVDSREGVLRIPLERWEVFQAKVAQALVAPRVSVRELARITGHAASLSLVVQGVARLQTRALYAAIGSLPKWSAQVVLGQEALWELRFWASLPRDAYTRSIWPRATATTDVKVVHTDASAFAWAGIGPAGEQAMGYLSPQEQALGSGAREMLAIQSALQAFAPVLKGHSVSLFTDSQNCEAICDHGSRKPHLQRLAIEVFTLCRAHDIDLSVVWIPREQNEQADALSKFEDREDWQIDHAIFSQLEAMWGPHEVDRFASHLNHVLPVFNSRFWCPGTAGVNAFAFNWTHFNNWCNPPFSLVGSVLTHMRVQGAQGTVIIPYWPKRPWWPLLEPRAGSWAPFVVGVWQLPPLPSVFRPGNFAGPVGGPRVPKWVVFALRLDFSVGYECRQGLPLVVA